VQTHDTKWFTCPIIAFDTHKIKLTASCRTIVELPLPREICKSRNRQENPASRKTHFVCHMAQSGNPTKNFAKICQTFSENPTFSGPPRCINSAGSRPVFVTLLRNVKSEMKKRNLGKIFILPTRRYVNAVCEAIGSKKCTLA
jgi:hypothetical protein